MKLNIKETLQSTTNIKTWGTPTKSQLFKIPQVKHQADKVFLSPVPSAWHCCKSPFRWCRRSQLHLLRSPSSQGHNTSHLQTLQNLLFDQSKICHSATNYHSSTTKSIKRKKYLIHVCSLFQKNKKQLVHFTYHFPCPATERALSPDRLAPRRGRRACGGWWSGDGPPCPRHWPWPSWDSLLGEKPHGMEIEMKKMEEIRYDNDKVLVFVCFSYYLLHMFAKVMHLC